MHNESLGSKSASWRFAGGFAALGALASLVATPGCGDRFSCKDSRTCASVAGAGGEGARDSNEDEPSVGGGNEGGPPSGPGQEDCEAGAISCQGQLVLQCQGGTWTQVGTCPFACMGNGECGGECVPDTRDCAGNTPRLCTAAGAWKELEDCTDACSGEGNCIGQCIPESKDCLNGVPRTCSVDGEWQEAAACPFVCEGAGECGGECLPEDGKCEANVPYVCNEAGVWIAQPACEKVCSGKGECTGACKPGDKECSGNKPRTCNEQGEWDEAAACEFVCSGAGECTGECVPGAKACDGYGYKTCGTAGAYVRAECPTATPVCGGAGVCGGSCVAWNDSIEYDAALVGECCTTSKGTGFLAKSSIGGTMSCSGIGNDPAFKKLVTASSALAANPASNINDGDATTLWKASTTATNEWVMIDFGETLTLKGVVFTYEQPGAYGYKVETSAVGAVWNNRGTATSAGEFAAEEIRFVSASTRYLRVVFTSLPSGRRAALASVRVY